MSRFDKIAALLEGRQLDAILITSAPNRLYATGFPSSAGAAVVTRAGSYFITDSRYIEAAGKKIQNCRVLENTRTAPVLALVENILQAHKVQHLGYEDERTTVREYQEMGRQLSAQLVPASDLLTQVRTAKDREEIDTLIAAQRIAEKALEEVLSFIRPGRTEKEVAAFLQYQMLLGGAEKMSFDPIVVAGPNSSMPHGVPTDRPLADGDFLTMDFGCIYNGYCSDMTRTVAIGHVTEEMERVYRTVLQAQLAGIAQVRPNVPGKVIHSAAAQVIADAGYGEYFRHGFGHGLGIELHEMPGAGGNSETPLPVGTVLSAEPGIYLPDRFGVRIEDVVVITESGCMNITKAPKDLLVL